MYLLPTETGAKSPLATPASSGGSQLTVGDSATKAVRKVANLPRALLKLTLLTLTLLKQAAPATTAPPSFTTIAGARVSIGASNVVIAGTMLTPGSSAATIDGTLVSLGSSGSKTENFVFATGSAGPSPSGGIGAMILATNAEFE